MSQYSFQYKAYNSHNLRKSKFIIENWRENLLPEYSRCQKSIFLADEGESQALIFKMLERSPFLITTKQI